MEIKELFYFASACLLLVVTLWDARRGTKQS